MWAPGPDEAMRTTTRCLLLAVLIAGLGLGLRLAMPVAPVDGPFRDVLRAYGTQGEPAPSNTGETSSPQ